MKLQPVIIIPARMGSTRLPGKPLADIKGRPMIVRVVDQALKAKAGPVFVAAAEEEIATALSMYGHKAILTAPDLPSGSDRIYAALHTLPDKEKYPIIINVQGDMPLIDPKLIDAVMAPFTDPEVHISTLVTPVKSAADKNNPNRVKAVVANVANKVGRAIYFTRAPAPYGDDEFYYHIGIYAYRVSALETFVGLPPSPLEQREKLEQLRALEAGLRIAAVVVEAEPLGVDTPDDLEKARSLC